MSKTSPYTYLGPRPLVVNPDVGLHTALADHRLPVVPRHDAVARRGFGDGTGKFLRNASGIVLRHDLHEVRVEGRGPFPYQADGDDLGDVENLDIDYEADALTIVLP